MQDLKKLINDTIKELIILKEHKAMLINSIIYDDMNDFQNNDKKLRALNIEDINKLEDARQDIDKIYKIISFIDKFGGDKNDNK